MGCAQSKNTSAKETPDPVYKATNTANSKHRASCAVNGDSRGSVGVAVSDHQRKIDGTITDASGPTQPTQYNAGKRDKSQTAPKQRKKAPFVKDKFDPRVLQKYEVKALIGRGSFSKVSVFAK